ncbi:RNA polymerase sigma-70 factor [Carboxylicivirga sp. A043]|uniref:RNA polymerase sigma-70 factor n=1 Tax=Carboxylicivirga litoralis TaxID=2816963 RepID=UPI0021CAE8E9|nr:RNA polymerase sigma-70 factor [Carboxylicivirga sp. A043]MCU4156368.1 RNA polymerase sigma-70 factor [Carboxylicivirga sp. A043]
MNHEKEIVRKVKAGDIDAFQVFYKAYFKRLCNYASLFVCQSDVAEDIVQDAFFKLWDKHSSIDTEQSVVGLLYRSIRNQCLNQLNHDKVHEKFIAFAKNYEAIDRVYRLDFDLHNVDTDHFYVFSEILKAIEDLPVKRKEVYKLSKIEGHAHNEIAQQLNISSKGVERHITLANKTLQTKLKHLKTAIFVLALLP